MTQSELEAMLKESDLMSYGLGKDGFKFFSACSTFAKLVAEKERERISQKIAQLPFGDTAQSLSIWVKNDT
jgi:hypothetical protein